MPARPIFAMAAPPSSAWAGPRWPNPTSSARSKSTASSSASASAARSAIARPSCVPSITSRANSRPVAHRLTRRFMDRSGTRPKRSDGRSRCRGQARRQHHGEAGALADRAVHVHVTAVHFDKQLDHAEAQPQPAAVEFIITRRMARYVEAREKGIEDPWQAGLVDAHARVRYRDGDGPVGTSGGEQADTAAVGSEFDGIDQKLNDAVV